ncbi:MAG: hypothetical protein M0R06_04515 [Sphaerochaeta sp.]|jgi:hypothetical protein|nr:hypothetical protein [Sphaerochaeta sp.]
MRLKNKIVALCIVVLLLVTSLACFRDNEDFLMIEESQKNTQEMESNGQIP